MRWAPRRLTTHSCPALSLCLFLPHISQQPFNRCRFFIFIITAVSQKFKQEWVRLFWTNVNGAYFSAKFFMKTQFCLKFQIYHFCHAEREAGHLPLRVTPITLLKINFPILTNKKNLTTHTLYFHILSAFFYKDVYYSLIFDIVSFLC